MAFRVGERVGTYEIRGPLGAGGMGEVYRAFDPRLGREVAIKVLPAEVSGNPDRLARFDREARTLAALNHPGIGAIYGVEDSSQGRLLILELVPGETLAERVARGRVSVKGALQIGQQIAAAVSYAHASGVVHRDLKPANIKCTPDGKIKVLDFGLAKALAPASGVARADESTAVVGDTQAGMIIGSPGYMSPEQARGDEIDRRTDIWAFGCILYQLLTGRAPFPATTIADALAAILKTEPDWSLLPQDTPPSIRTLLKRCLQRERDRRLHDIADARIEIEDALAGHGDPSAPAATRAPLDSGERAAVVAIVAAALMNSAFMFRLVPDLAGTYSEFGLELSFPLRLYLGLTALFVRMLPIILLIGFGIWFLRRRRPWMTHATRRAALGAVATIVCTLTMVGLYFVGENSLVHLMRLELAAANSGQVLQRDFASLYLAASEPQKAIDIIDPKHDLERTFREMEWGSAGRAMHIAEAYRALGNVDAARRWYGRAQQAATAFDEVVSVRLQERRVRLQARYSFPFDEWMPETTSMRAFPDLVKSVAQQKLNQLTAPPAR